MVSTIMSGKVFDVMFGVGKLRRLKLKALRGGVWFRALSRIDRVLIDLTMKVCNEVRSLRLAKVVFSVVKKLEDALESSVLRAVKEVGVPLVRRLSFVAWKWGNTSALSWVYDPSFARFLAVMYVNDLRVLGGL